MSGVKTTSKLPSPLRNEDRTVRAEHASSKSGYARDVAPDIALVGMAAKPVPPASRSGRQEGVTPPADRAYTARYGSGTAQEVLARTLARERGELPMIEGGVMEQKRRGPARAQPQAQVKQAQAPAQEEIYDEGSDDNPSFDSFTAGGGALIPGQAPGSVSEPEPVVIHSPRYAPAPVQVQAHPVQSYLNGKKRVTLELGDGTMRINAVDVIVDKYGVLVLTSTVGDANTFVPKPGSDVSISVGDKTYPCYFPGASFEIEALNLLALPFVRAEE